MNFLLLTDNEKLADQYSSQLKDERRMRKDAEVKVTSLQEELQESKSTNQELEKSLTDRKKKLTDERQRFETEMEEIKSRYEVRIHVHVTSFCKFMMPPTKYFQICTARH